MGIFNSLTEKIETGISKNFNKISDIGNISQYTNLKYDNPLNVTDILQSSYDLGGGFGYDMNMLDSLINQIVNKSSSTNSNNGTYPQENENGEDATEEIAVTTDESKENYTDPLVDKSPTLQFKPVAIQDSFAPENINEEGELDNNEINTINTEEYPFYDMGYTFPLINFNGRILQKHEIAYLEVTFDDVAPTFELGIFDLGVSTNNIKQVVPGMENEINIKIRPSMNGKYKTALLDFFITEFTMGEYFYKPIFKCKGTYKLKELYNGTPKSITLEHGIISNEDENAKYQLSTYEYLLEIAYLTGLGLQATQNCESINDRRLRYKQNETYIDFIKKQIAIGGLDEHSIFDCWINMYGSLTLVNVAWIFEQVSEISPNFLTCYANVGLMNTDGNGVGQNWKKIYRTLTNLNTLTMSNMKFTSDNYVMISDNNSRNEGLNSSTMTLGVIGTGSGNNGSISNSEVQCIDNSVDGRNYKDNYNIKSFPDIEMNMSNNETNIIDQRTIRKSFFNIKRAKHVMLTLDEFNFSIDRGYLVNIAYFVTSKNEKSFIIHNLTNIEGDESAEKLSYSLPDGMTIQDIIEDDNYPMLDMSKSGIFYVDKMYIKYFSNENRIKQVLDLIKIGDSSSYQNKFSYPKFIDSYMEELKENDLANIYEPKIENKIGDISSYLKGFTNNLDNTINTVINKQ